MSLEMIGNVLAAERRRDEFLEEHPELRALQNKIDDTLNEIGNDPIARCRVMNSIMMSHAYIMNDKLQDLHSYVEDSKVMETIDEIVVEINKIKKEIEDDLKRG